MPTSISVKNVPDDILARLKDRAARNHRSLQGEILSLLEEAVRPKHMSLKELKEKVEAMNLKTQDEATEMIRELRDGR